MHPSTIRVLAAELIEHYGPGGTGEDPNVVKVARAYLAETDPDPDADDDGRPTTTCGCGHRITYYGPEDGWQHDAAPHLWGDDHDPRPDAAARARAAAYDAD